MHASGVRPLSLAPRPRWAAWSYYSSANIALPLALFVALAGYQSLSPTNNAAFRKER